MGDIVESRRGRAPACRSTVCSTAILALVLSSACTEIHEALPGVRATSPAGFVASTESATPDVLGARGPLSATRAEAVLEEAVDAAGDGRRAEELVKAVEVATDAPFVVGNRVRLLIDGPRTYDAVFTALNNARHSIHLETYWFADDETGNRFARLLESKADEGVVVRVIYDAIGSFWTSDGFFDAMAKHGVEVASFHPLSASAIGRLNNRDHRKLIVVDGSVAFTGGSNICDPYAEASTIKPGPKDGVTTGWRDTHAEIHGPAVALLQTYFLETWTRLGGQVDPSASGFFPHLTTAGDDLVQVVSSDGGDDGEFRIYNAYLEAIDHAQHRVWISQAYFSPDRRLRTALSQAALRGVDVRIIVPGFTNSALVYHASRATYSGLLEAGIAIYEHSQALLHAKTAVIDGVWSTVGSSNLDRRSFIHNNELNVVVVGAAFAASMETLFRTDLRNSERIDVAAWKQRPALDRIKECLSRRLAYWL